MREILASVWPLLAAVLILVWLAWESVRTLSGIRTYVNGESLWAKGQKDALYNLLEYARTGERPYYDAYAKALEVPLGDMLLRVSIQPDIPDMKGVWDGSMQGGAHPDDFDDAFLVLRRFQHAGFMADAIRLWTRADAGILELRQMGWRIDAAVRAGNAVSLDELRVQLAALGEELSQLNSEFSLVLGDASRLAKRLLIMVMLGATLVLVPLGLWLVRRIMVAAEKSLQEKDRLQKEVQIAAQIQTLILPPPCSLSHFQVSARLVPATPVGGNYYDVVPASDGCWLALGNTSGRGLTAGLMGLMTQSALMPSLAVAGATPASALAQVNGVLFDNIRRRMGQAEEVALGLLRCHDDGRVECEGSLAHLLVWRAHDQTCERFHVRGSALGVASDLGLTAAATRLQLAIGDILCVCSEGAASALSREGMAFGDERIATSLCAEATLGPDAVVSRVIADVWAWAGRPHNDVTVVAMLYRGPGDEAVS